MRRGFSRKDVFNGVIATSNGSAGTYKPENKCSDADGCRLGVSCLCAEYVGRYCKRAFGRQITGGRGNSYCRDASGKGLSRAPKGGTDKPQVGNILVSEGGGCGQVAIVRQVGKDPVKVIRQNFQNNPAGQSLRLRQQ